MSMVRVVLVFVLFNITLNVLANIFAQSLPVAYHGAGAEQYLSTLQGSADLNISEISSEQSTGFAVDVRRGLSLLTSLRDYVLGGSSLVMLFGMDPGAGTGHTIATAIDAIQFVVYLLALFMLFMGRGD